MFFNVFDVGDQVSFLNWVSFNLEKVSVLNKITLIHKKKLAPKVCTYIWDLRNSAKDLTRTKSWPLHSVICDLNSDRQFHHNNFLDVPLSKGLS